MNKYEVEITRNYGDIDHTTVYADTLLDAATIATRNIVECDAITMVKLVAFSN